MGLSRAGRGDADFASKPNAVVERQLGPVHAAVCLHVSYFSKRDKRVENAVQRAAPRYCQPWLCLPQQDFQPVLRTHLNCCFLLFTKDSPDFIFDSSISNKLPPTPLKKKSETFFNSPCYKKGRLCCESATRSFTADLEGRAAGLNTSNSFCNMRVYSWTRMHMQLPPRPHKHAHIRVSPTHTRWHVCMLCVST